MKNAPLKSAQRRGLWKCGQGPALPTAPQHNRARRSGHSKRYQNRTTQFAVDRMNYH